MLVPKSWLNDFIQTDNLSESELKDILTNLGHEVENIHHFNAMHELIVMAYVQNVTKHPNADKLNLCTVIDQKDGAALQVVCGADNVKAGMHVALAKIGAILPDGTKIKKTKIRDYESYGMICSVDELGIIKKAEGTDTTGNKLFHGILDLNHENLLLLNNANFQSKDYKTLVDNFVFQPMEKLLKLKDTVFDLSITPNRSDCNSIFGIARELAAKLNIAVSKSKNSLEYKGDTSDFIQIKITSFELSTKFCALYISNIPGSITPFKIQRRLTLCGQDPVNLIVDCANYIRIEFAQPIHTYDYDKLENKSLIVNLAKKNDKEFASLDGGIHKLNNKDIVITDNKNTLCLAGVMGSKCSAIDHTTKNCIIEGAHFDSYSITKTQKTHNLNTDAGYLFARKIDLLNIEYCVNKVAKLIFDSVFDSCEICIYKSIEKHDDQKSKFIKRKIALRVERARAITGFKDLSWQNCQDILDRLEIRLIDRKATRLLVEIPSYRNDLTKEIDLIEELARIIGFDKIKPTIPQVAKNQLSSYDPLDHHDHSLFYKFNLNLKTSLAHQGLSEVILYPFSNESDYKKFLIDNDHYLFPKLSMLNPLSKQFNLISTLPVIEMVKALVYNKDNNRKNTRLFQISRGYHLEKKSTNTHSKINSNNQLADKYYHANSFYADNNKHKPFWFSAKHQNSDYDNFLLKIDKKDNDSCSRPKETPIVSIVFDQPWHTKNWDNTKEILVNFYHLKSLVLSIAESVGINNNDLFKFEKIDCNAYPFLNPANSAIISYNNYFLGYIGQLHPRVCLNFDLSLSYMPYICEISVENLYLCAINLKTNFLSANPFPPSYRDLAIIVKNEITHRQVIDAIDNFKFKKFLKEANLFDLYQGDNIENGYKSMAYSLVFSSSNQTLKEKHINKEFNQLMQHLVDSLDAKLRNF